MRNKLNELLTETNLRILVQWVKTNYPELEQEVKELEELLDGIR